MIFKAGILQVSVPDGRVFGLDQQTLIQIGIQLFNAVVLSIILGFILYKPVRAFLKQRADKISGRFEDARTSQAKADALLAEYENKLKEIDTERIQILESSKYTAAEQSRQMLEEAKREAAEIKRRAHDSVLAEREWLKEETRLHIIEVSSLMAGKIVSRTIDSSDQDRIFEETMAELEDASWQS